MLKLSLFAVILTMPFWGLTQSSTLLEEGVDKTVEIGYSAKPSDNINNQMVGLVAKAKSLPKEQTKLIYKVKEHRKIIKSGTNLQLLLAVGNLVNGEDIKYLNFGITGFVKPSLVTYKYVWEDKDGTVLETKKIENVPFKNGDYLLKNTFPDTYNETTYKLYLSELALGFTASDVKKLDEFINTIDGYYNADARLNLLEQELAQLTVDSIELLETNYQKTVENLKVFSQIKSQRFSSKLDLDSNDPIKLISHLGRAEEQNKALKKELEFARENMHITYYKKGLDWQRWNNQPRANEYFSKSIQSKVSYAPPYIELAQFNFGKKNFSSAIDTCKKVLVTLKPDTDTRYKAVKLSESVIYVYIDSVKSFIDTKNFSQAVALFAKCRQYAKDIPGIKTFAEFEEIQTSLYQAYYAEMAEKSSNLIASGELMAAHRSLDSMSRFRVANSKYLTDANKENKLLQTLYDAWITKGKNFLEANQTDSSLMALEQASDICHRYPAISCTDDLNQLSAQAYQTQYNQLIENAKLAIDDKLADSALVLLQVAKGINQKNNIPVDTYADTLFQAAKQLKYHDLIMAGDQAYNQNQMREALSFYQEAIEQEHEIKLVQDAELPDRLKAAAKSIVLILCNQSEAFIEAMNLPEAQQRYSQANNMAIQFEISGNKEVSAALEALSEQLNQGKCNQWTQEYNVQISVAKKFIDRRDFILSEQALKKAAEVNNAHKECLIDNQEGIELGRQISAMVHYQKQVKHIDDLLNEKEYSDAVENYIQLTAFYADSCHNNYGIEHRSLDIFISTHSNSMFIDFGVRYYTELGNTDFAISLLEILRKRDYISSWSQLSQETLGTKLALSDYEIKPETNPKLKVLEYTKSDKWYNYLKKSYLIQWSKF
jgi:hypothetical protein